MAELKITPLDALHRELGARMAPFAGYDMPIQYRAGILAEHAHTRTKAGLFDVSHMGQAWLEGPDYETTAGALERLCAADLRGLAPGRQRYSQLLNADGGIVDDFMATRPVGDAHGLYWSSTRLAKRSTRSWSPRICRKVLCFDGSKIGPCWPCRARRRLRCFGV